MTRELFPGRQSSVHASAIVVGEKGILIMGPSGAGKSSLSLAIIQGAQASGTFAALIADDRVLLTAASGRLLARAVPGYEGMIERRGEGLLTIGHEPRTAVRLVIDLSRPGEPPPRLPAEEDRFIELLGIRLPRLLGDFRSGPGECALAALRRVGRDI